MASNPYESDKTSTLRWREPDRGGRVPELSSLDGEADGKFAMKIPSRYELEYGELDRRDYSGGSPMEYMDMPAKAAFPIASKLLTGTKNTRKLASKSDDIAKQSNNLLHFNTERMNIENQPMRDLLDESRAAFDKMRADVVNGVSQLEAMQAEANVRIANLFHKQPNDLDVYKLKAFYGMDDATIASLGKRKK